MGAMQILTTTKATELNGLAGWVLGRLRGSWTSGSAQEKELRLIETLPLGGKRQLMLVTCAGEKFLVGGTAEGIQTIVCVQTGTRDNQAIGAGL